MRFVEDCQAADKLKKHDTYWKNAVYGLIAITIIVFCVDYGIEMGESVNQLNRGLIIASYVIVGFVFVFFSIRLLKEIHRNLHGQYAIKNARRVNTVMYIFICSIVYRILFNTAYLSIGDGSMCMFSGNHPAWFAFI